jgi:hypothetical protein
VKALIIVRALNEEAVVGDVVSGARRGIRGSDILVVDDGSTDGTARVARAAGARVLRLRRTQGMGAAVQRGYRAALDAGYGAALQMDGDGQHRVADGAAVLAARRDGAANVVVGSRYMGAAVDHGSSRGRRLGTRVLSRSLSTVAGQRITDATSGLRACDRRAMAVFAREYPQGHVESEALLVAWRHGLSVAEVPVVMLPRRAGRSSISRTGAVYYGWRAAVGLMTLAAGRVGATRQEAA